MRVTFLTFVLATSIILTSAPGAFAGNEFYVNSAFDRPHFGPVADMNAAGRLVVSWQTETEYDPGGGPEVVGAIRARTFDVAAGAASPVLSVPYIPFPYLYTYEPGEFHGQLIATGAAVDDAGRIALSWNGTGMTDPFMGGKQFDAAGSALGSGVGGFGYGSSVAVEPGGTVQWMLGRPALGSGPIVVMGARSDAAGQPVGGEFSVSGLYAHEPAVALNAVAGIAAVVYTYDNELNLYERDVALRRYDLAGNPLGSEVMITSANLHSSEPDVAVDDAGNIVVVWQRSEMATNHVPIDLDVVAQRFDSAGNPAGGEIAVNTTTAGHQRNPDIAIDAAGRFIVAFDSENSDYDLYGYGILAQRFDADGTRLGGEFPVNQSTVDDQVDPCVVQNENDIVVVWETAVGGTSFIAGRVFGDAAVTEAAGAPPRLALRQNVPNPFNPSTTIAFTLDRPERARLDVVDAAGHVVRTLHDRSTDAGVHRVSWDGRDGSGRPVASGIYFCRLVVGGQSLSRKMVLLK